jgi:Flp pilus assembly protein TadD
VPSSQSRAIAASQAARQHLVHGDVDRAEEIVRAALAEAPDDPNLLYAAGNCALVRHDDERALELYGRCIARAPSFLPPLLNMGFVHRRHQRLDEARRILRVALRLEPRNAAVWLNLTSTYVNEGDPQAGEAVAREALTLCPASPDIRWNLALLLLEQGRWEEGWEEYRQRFDTPAVKAPRYGPAATYPPRLRRLADISAGQTVVCHGEQGLGDEILFAGMLAEFAADVGRRGGRLVLDCHPRLRGLYAGNFCSADGQVSLLPMGDAAGGIAAARAAFAGPIDWATPIGDLGGFFRNAAADFPDRRGYLVVAPQRVVEIREMLARHARGRPLVGLAWTGGLEHTHAVYRRIPLDDWLPVLRQEACFVSLEYRDREAEIAACRERHGIEIVSLPEITQARNYLETFHLVAALDLVITVPTSVLHVAGALGRPCWIVMHARAAWRECSPDASVPWYPGTHARFVRALADPSWGTVIDRVSTALRKSRPGPPGG